MVKQEFFYIMYDKDDWPIDTFDSIKEIAKKTGMPKGTVESTISRTKHNQAKKVRIYKYKM